jgi:hypothetical protein
MKPTYAPDPEIVGKLYNGLPRQAKIRQAFAALRGKIGFYEHLTIECTLLVGVHPSDY